MRCGSPGPVDTNSDRPSSHHSIGYSSGASVRGSGSPPRVEYIYVRPSGPVSATREPSGDIGISQKRTKFTPGGVNDFASPNRTKLYRKAKDKTEVFDIELGDILNKGRLETNLFLRPGDVITVPERLF